MAEQLALFGGPPTRTAPMPSRRALGDDEFAMVKEVFEFYRREDRDPGYQDHFEELYARAFVEELGQRGYADAVATGTLALYVSLAALELPKGSTVLVSPITDPGTVNAIVANRLVPKLVDSMPDSYNVGPEQFAERLSDDVRAAIVVHAAGRAGPIDDIAAIARARDVLLVEDCSQAHGATRGGRKVGTFGDIAAFSTMYRKAHITGGCGGVVYTRSLDRYRKLRAHADRGKAFWAEDFDDKDPTRVLHPALNLHQDEVSCAIGIASLKRLESTRQRRIAFVQQLEMELKPRSEVCRLHPVSEQDSPFYHLIFVDSGAIGCDKIEFARAVEAEGVDVNTHYRYVVDEWPYIRPYLADDFHTENARRCRDGSFNLLFNENYGPAEASDIATAIGKVERHYLRAPGTRC